MKQNERLLKIDELLHRDSHPNLQDLLKCAGSTVSTTVIMRDLEKLRHNFNREIVFDRDTKCYRYREDYPCLSQEDFNMSTD